MTTVTEVRQLRVGQKAIDRSLDVFGVAEALPADERSGLTSQRRQAAVSLGAG
jgi:hypothetical protein